MSQLRNSTFDAYLILSGVKRETPKCPKLAKKLLTFLIFFGMLMRRLKERVWRSTKKLPQNKWRLLLRSFASNKMALYGVDETQ